MVIGDKQHRRQFEETMKAASAQSSHGVLKGASLQRLYDTQCLWDEYMAESATNYLNINPQSTLVVIAGSGHVIGRHGLPNRIMKRLRSGTAPFVIVSEEVDWLSETGLPDIDVPLKPRDCDWAWYTQKEIMRS